MRILTRASPERGAADVCSKGDVAITPRSFREFVGLSFVFEL